MAKHSLANSKGVMLLSCVTLLLMLSATSVFYLLAHKNTQASISRNQQSFIKVKTSAENGLRFAIAHLQSNPEFKGDLLAQSKGLAPLQNISATHRLLSSDPFELQLTELVASAESEQGAFRHSIQAQLLIAPLLKTVPAAPLIIKGQLDNDDLFYLVTNPEGAGPNRPVSIWSDKPVKFHSQALTCTFEQDKQQRCTQQPLSSATLRALDVVDKDSGFPSDLLSHLFNLSLQQIEQLRLQSHRVLDDCQNLDEFSTGIIFIEQDCHIDAFTQNGRAEHPLLLILNGKKLMVGRDSRIYGLLVSTQALRVEMDKQARITGALAASNGLLSGANSFEVQYSKAVLERLQLDTFKTVALVRGSWRDF